MFFATASLYLVLVSELEKSTDLFLADKVNVLRTMLAGKTLTTGMRCGEEIELESAARQYEHFYIRLLDERDNQLLMTPGMAEQLDLLRFASRTRNSSGSPHWNDGKTRARFPRHQEGTSVPVGSGASSHLRPSGGNRCLAKSGSAGTISFLVLGNSSSVVRDSSIVWLPHRARHGIRPVEEMATTAPRQFDEDVRERILPEGYPFELASLASTFNQMLDRLEESFERISRFSADIAHDLRTPVNNIRGEAEVALARARATPMNIAT